MSPIDIFVITIGQALSLLIIADSLLSFAISPDHPIRETLGRILNPLYAPIRRFVSPAGGMDFSPLVLLLLIQLVVRLLTSIF